MSNDKKAKDKAGDQDPEWDDLGSNATGGGSKMGDTIKKLLATGVSAAFMTEESIRRLVTDMHLPKETMNLLLQGASRSKEELMNRVSREVITIISKIDFVKEASRFVEEHKFRVTAEIEVLPKTGSKNAAAPGNTPEATMDPSSKVEIKLS
ncbi:hypothetical protein BH10BDE1_BH10BDE1_11820 [soil metagenome]